MKSIIVNGKFFSQRITGVQRYAREILAELDRLLNETSEIKITIAVPKDVIEIPEYKNIEIVYIGHFTGILWEQISLPLFARNKGILLNLCNASPIISPGIVCIHDVKIKARPKDFSKLFLVWYNFLFFNAARRAKKIITVSNFSKNEILKYYKINPDKISVISNGWQHYERIGYDENTFRKFGLENTSYFFSMCSLEPNKNFKWIAEVALQNPDQIFAVAGTINKKIFSDGLEFELPVNMKLLGYISDEEAKTLMRDCSAFLFPTFYEGFGVPPLEAACAGAKIIVVSDTPVMHEIFGDEVFYIDPYKYEFKINQCIQQRKDYMKNYSWKKSAKELKSLLMS